MLAIAPCQISLLLATGSPLIRVMLAIAPAQTHASHCPCQISLMLATALHPPHAFLLQRALHLFAYPQPFRLHITQAIHAW